MELYVADSYSSTCYVEDEASLFIDGSKLVVLGTYGDCITISYNGKAILTNTEIIGDEYVDTSSFYDHQYGVVAYGEVFLKNVDIKHIEEGVYVESEKPVSIISCNIFEVESAISVLDSTDVTIDGGNYIAK